MTSPDSTSAPVVETTIIDARHPYRLFDWQELRQYRDLFYFLVWRDVKGQYAQSVLGIGWAIIQPLFNMVVFTIVFGRLARVDSDGVPYAIFSYTALVPWTYFAGALTASGTSLVNSANVLTKVYFPRLVVPIVPVLAKLVDFAIAFVILIGMMLWFRIRPTTGVFLLPLLILLMMLTAVGVGMWLTALSVQYRDIKYGLNFGVQLLMYAAPVVYSASTIPERYRWLYGLNPMAGVIEGFRSALLDTVPMPWDFIVVGTISAVVIALSGLVYFRYMERIFADVV
jgi:lipopolysaccharide transport system permease protein